MRRLALGLAAALAGCTPPLYVSAVPHAPFFEETGAVQVRGVATSAGLAGAAYVSPLRHVGVFGEAEAERAGMNLDYARSRRVYGGGLVLYGRVGPGLSVEGLAGLARGHVEAFGEEFRFSEVNARVRETARVRRSYVQASAGGLVRRDLLLAGGLRVARAALLDYVREEEDRPPTVPTALRASLVEPLVLARLGGEVVKGELSIGWTFALRRDSAFTMEGSRLSAGATFALDRLLRPRQEAGR